MSSRRARSIAKELSAADLGDERLSARLGAMGETLMARPGASLPQMTGDEAGLEGAYRFLNNDKVHAGAILAPHQLCVGRRSRRRSRPAALVEHARYVVGLLRDLDDSSARVSGERARNVVVGR